MAGVTGRQFMIFEWILVAFTLFLILLRFRIRYKHGKGFNVCDTFVALAWIFFGIQSSLDTVEYAKGMFAGRFNPSVEPDKYGPENGLMSYEDTVILLKIIWVQTVIYYITMYCVKFAVIAFLFELIPHALPRLRQATWFALGLSIVGIVSTVLLKLLYCQPIRSNWAVGAGHCHNLDSPVTDIYRWSFHAVTDLIIYMIPIFLVRKTQLPTAQKVGVALTFSAGFVCIIFAVVVQASFVVFKDPVVVSFTWAAGEQSWSILVVCLPAFKSFLTHDMWTKVSKMFSRGSISSDSDETDGTGVKELSFFRRRGKKGSNRSDPSSGESISPVPSKDHEFVTKVESLPV